MPNYPHLIPCPHPTNTNMLSSPHLPILLLLFTPLTTPSPLLNPQTPPLSTLNQTHPWHCTSLPSWTSRDYTRSVAAYKAEDCLRAMYDFRTDSLKAHTVPYQWLAVGAAARKGRGQAVFTPRRYVFGELRPLCVISYL